MPPETVMLRPHAVRALLRAASFDVSDNTIEIVWTTGAAVQRYDWDGSYTETLVVTPKAVRMARLNGGVPFLNAHSSWDLADIIGRTVPGSAVIADGEGTCRVKLSEDPAKAGIVADIRAGVIADVSVGYIVHQMVRTEAQDGQCASCLVTDWEPIEISAVPIPADADAKIRSSPTTGAAERGETHPCTVTRAAPTAPAIDPAALAREARAAETHRVQGILAVARGLGLPAGLADTAIAGATALPDFRTLAIDAVATRSPTPAAEHAAPAPHEGSSMPPIAADAAPATDAARAAAAPAAPVDIAAIRAAETARIQGIISTARKLGLPSDSADRAIAENVALEAFRTLAIDAAAERQAPASFNVLPSGEGRAADGGQHRSYAQPRAERPKGTDATRLMIALAATRGARGDAAAFVSHHYGDDGAVLARALSTSVGSAGGFLVPVEMSAEIIELLRPASTVMALGPQILPMPAGNLFVPRATTGSSANYVGENQPAGASQPGFGGVQLSAKKLVALVPISNDMIKYAGPATDGFIRGDMIKAIAQRADLAFLRGAGTQFSPRGLRSFAAAPALNGSNVLLSNPTINLQNTVNDLRTVRAGAGERQHRHGEAGLDHGAPLQELSPEPARWPRQPHLREGDAAGHAPRQALQSHDADPDQPGIGGGGRGDAPGRRLGDLPGGLRPGADRRGVRARARSVQRRHLRGRQRQHAVRHLQRPDRHARHRAARHGHAPGSRRRRPHRRALVLILAVPPVP